MSKIIYLQRHGDINEENINPKTGMWQPKLSLSPEGINTIKKMKKYLSGQHFDILLRSWFTRAKETSEISVPNGIWKSFPNLVPRLYKEVDEKMANNPIKLSSMKDFENFYPGVLGIEQEWISRGIQKVLELLKDEQQALLIGHQPHLDLLRSIFFPPFSIYEQVAKRGDIYKMTFNSKDHLIKFEHLFIDGAQVVN